MMIMLMKHDKRKRVRKCGGKLMKLNLLDEGRLGKIKHLFILMYVL